jgi:ADP-heptose:LPS heptosyltransferase
MPKLNRIAEPAPQRIVILRALHIGDLLCAVPAFRALKTALPQAWITLIGLPWAHRFVERFNSYLDDFIPLPGYPGFPEQNPEVSRFPDFLARVQRLQYDLAIQMQGSGEISNPLIMLLGAKYCAGFYLPGQYCPDPERFLPYPEHEPEVWCHLRLMEFLGMPPQGDELEFPLYDQDWKELEGITAKFAIQSDYVCIHPGARSLERRWPVERFAGVADGLAAHGLQVILTGSREEAALTQAVAAKMQSPSLDLAGLTSLGALAALVSKARLVVSNDTGVAHIAAAVRTPSIVLFSASDPNRWAPQDLALHKVVTRAPASTTEEVLSQATGHLQEVYANAL